MVSAKIKHSNPYVAGPALTEKHDFFGREDILQLVETELLSTNQNAVVLFGQRRIGKTSVLLKLEHRLASQQLKPIYFDLMDHARQSLGQLLFELASTIISKIAIVTPEKEYFDDEGLYFRREFLPSLYKVLGEEQRLILLFDEFDVLDVAAEEQLLPTAAARAFFPYLRQLMQEESRLGFVFVVGRRAEELSIDVKATFKAARYKKVSVLDDKSARELVNNAKQKGTLTFEESASDRILALTAGHPYFTQLFCQAIWSDAYAGDVQGIPEINNSVVEHAIPKVLEAGHNIFDWIWEGLPPAERVIFAAIAEATTEEPSVTEEELLEILQGQGIRILTKELEMAPDTLVKWEMLRKVDGGYAFFIELMRRWVAVNKSLPRVKDELDRIVPLADTLYRSGNGFYRQSDLKSAQDQLYHALRLNPNHLKARLLLSQIMVEQGKLKEAIKELELAYKYDEDGARYPLIRAFMIHGEELERQGKDDEALEVYENVLKISPRENIAQEHTSKIWMQRGDKALNANDLSTALNAYQKAGAQKKVKEIQVGKVSAEAKEYESRKEWPKAIESYNRLIEIAPEEEKWPKAMEQVQVKQAKDYERREEWSKAIEIYERLKEAAPEEEQWEKTLAKIHARQRLGQLYAEGLGALKQGRWVEAQQKLAEVVHSQPDYRDAAKLLADAVNKGSKRILKPVLQTLIKTIIPLIVLLAITILISIDYYPTYDSEFLELYRSDFFGFKISADLDIHQGSKIFFVLFSFSLVILIIGLLMLIQEWLLRLPIGFLPTRNKRKSDEKKIVNQEET
jgi:tetratricopeptide (TPR) repeat protein